MLETQPVTTNNTRTQQPRHYVKLNRHGEPTDKTMCGKLWNRLHVEHNGSICQDCLDAVRARGDADRREREEWGREHPGR